MTSYYSPLFSNNFPLNTTTTPLEFALSRRLRGLRKRSAILAALNGVAPGATASWSYKRTVASQVEQGGSRPMETFYEINRVTTAQDVTDDNKILTRSSRMSSVVKRGGNFG